MENYSPAAPQAGFLRLRQVLALVPVHPSTWWRGVKSGRYPAPIKLSIGITCWRAEDIAKLINSKHSITEKVQ